MKKAILIIMAMFALTLASNAQTTFKLDTIAKETSMRPGRIVIDQSEAVSNAMSSHISRNAARSRVGYRIRIFFDNKQNARAMSEKVANSFKAQHPGISVYRGYENPYFKVTVGDFRNKEDARKFLNSIKGTYPSGFIVREKINNANQ